jgi:hypothetical protein
LPALAVVFDCLGHNVTVVLFGATASAPTSSLCGWWARAMEAFKLAAIGIV